MWRGLGGWAGYCSDGALTQLRGGGELVGVEVVAESRVKKKNQGAKQHVVEKVVAAWSKAK